MSLLVLVLVLLFSGGFSRCSGLFIGESPTRCLPVVVSVALFIRADCVCSSFMASSTSFFDVDSVDGGSEVVDLDERRGEELRHCCCCERGDWDAISAGERGNGTPSLLWWSSNGTSTSRLGGEPRRGLAFGLPCGLLRGLCV